MRLSETNIAIVGLGLMGGSLAMSLRGHCARLVGVARDPAVGQWALEQGVVDAVCELEQVAKEADIVVLATPVRHIIATIPGTAALMHSGALLLDLGSTKAGVVEVMNAIPHELGVAAIGGHPMCGKEVGGLGSAEATLYSGASFVLTPTLRTTHEALMLARELVGAVGARAVVLEAEQHDRAVAVISHLPYLLASTLVQTEAQASIKDSVTGTLAGGGIGETSRLEAIHNGMMLDILSTNGPSVEAALDLFEAQLRQVRALLGKEDEAGLKEWMVKARKRRREMF
jgi:prephenate dehydrogenase